MNTKILEVEDSNSTNNPNHPLVKCVDATGPFGEWTSADDKVQKTTRPYRVFDVLNQRHIGPKFPFRWMADVYVALLGGEKVSER